MSKRNELAEQHWKFIKELITIQREDIGEQDLKLLGFLYKQAFIHSWKHCLDDLHVIR